MFNLVMFLKCDYLFIISILSRQRGTGCNEVPSDNTQDTAPVDQPQVDYPNPFETAFRGTLDVYSWASSSEQENDLIPSVDPKRVLELLNVKVTQKGAICSGEIHQTKQ